ncbi:hypothetical protein BTA30_21140 [Bacillus swezeyi]|uniref:Uncharacterized protein n=1 Tax=Bacillus swezeyi TaxID=1925020 RepID=A0A1R1RGM8_9BACI|nr:hypothetical protein BW143_00765 [Bacillus swezeyi]OMI25179.1 hypothetical protein BTA30_21140 [Bacillus swezeyi]
MHVYFLSEILFEKTSIRRFYKAYMIPERSKKSAYMRCVKRSSQRSEAYSKSFAGYNNGVPDRMLDQLYETRFDALIEG